MFRVTNEDGRASAFLTWDEFLCAHYKMRFEVGEYFASHGAETFFPYAEVRESLITVFLWLRLVLFWFLMLRQMTQI